MIAILLLNAHELEAAHEVSLILANGIIYVLEIINNSKVARQFSSTMT